VPAPRRHLDVETLRRYVTERCLAPSDEGIVGVELELLTYPSADPSLRPPAEQLEAITSEITLPAGSHITLEPGGQVEISSRPLPGLDAALAATATDLVALSAGLRWAGLEPVSRGLDPLRPPERILDRPRYAAMEAFFDGEGFAGRTMMCSTAAIQVNVDNGSVATLTERWHLAHAVGPLLVAMFAHSPVPGGGGCGPRSARQQVWSVLDPSRTAPAHGPVLEGDGRSKRSPAEEWLRYALDARVMMIRVTPERFVLIDGLPGSRSLTFAEWMDCGHEHGWPTLDDFEYHLTTLFPPVRPRGWLELRMIDALPDPWWRVAAAVTTALLEDSDAGAEALEAVSAPPSGTGVADHWRSAARHGLADPALRAAAQQVFPAALAALGRLGVDQATVAAAEVFHERFVARGLCPADDPVPLPEVEPAAIGSPEGINPGW
jgi:glutamate--cysteine ligase